MKRLLTALTLTPLTAITLTIALVSAQAQAQASAQAVPASPPPAERAGKVLYKGQWLRKYDVEKLKYAAYMKARGYVNYHGKWRRKKEARKIQRDVVRQLNRLTNKYSGTRRRAHKELLKLSKKHEMPRLVAIAGRVKKDYDEYWRSYWRRETVSSRTVTMGVRLQNTKVLGIDTVPVSLGVGTPVRIQLPRTRSITLGTTVTVPAGIGR